MDDWLDHSDQQDPRYDREMWQRNLAQMSEKHKNARVSFLAAPRV
jgi:hypothetical protein